MYIPDVVCPKCGEKQQYNLNGTDFWGHKVAECCICRHKWEVKREEFRPIESSKRCNLEDFTTEELLKELERRKR